MKKFLFLLFAVFIALSYFYSREIYTFYVKTYYEKYQKKSIDDLVGEAEKLYKLKEYEKLLDFVETMRIVYPENDTFRKLEGVTHMKLGNKKIGAAILLSSMGGERIPDKVLDEAIQTFFRQKLYRDIIFALEVQDPGTNQNLWYYYAVSLFETGKYQKALKAFQRALREGRTDYTVYHYIGRAHEKLGNDQEALKYIDQAWDMNYRDREVNKSLVGIYRKLGRYDDAERILRRGR